jgi:hypothetical protein
MKARRGGPTLLDGKIAYERFPEVRFYPRSPDPGRNSVSLTHNRLPSLLIDQVMETRSSENQIVMRIGGPMKINVADAAQKVT